MLNICRCRWFLQMSTWYGRHLCTPLHRAARELRGWQQHQWHARSYLGIYVPISSHKHEAQWFQAQRQFRARSIKPNDKFWEYQHVNGVFVHTNPADGQLTKFALDIQFCWGLTWPRQFRISERRTNRNYARGWQRMERNVLRGQILASLRSSSTTHVWTRSIQIQQWSINQIKQWSIKVPHLHSIV